MKKINSISAFLMLLACVSSSYADHPNISVSGEIDIVYDTDVIIDVSQTYNEGLDFSVNQFNHEAGVKGVAKVIGNSRIDETEVEVTAVGNNASIELVNHSEITGVAVQGNQVGGVTAIAKVNGNSVIGDAEVAVDVTAVNNNLSIVGEGDVDLSSTQFNYDSPAHAVATINHNRFGVPAQPRDPKIDMTVVGNNLSVAPSKGSHICDVTASMTQLNRNSSVTGVAQVIGNRGVTSLVNVNVSAVGNNISISNVGSTEGLAE